MNFADPQPAVSTLSDRDGGFEAYSVVIAGAGLHPRHFRQHARQSELTRRFTMPSELEISKPSTSGRDTPVDERLPIVCGPVAIAAVAGAPMSVRFLHPQRRCREGQLKTEN
jgi:hypothetical protein